MQGVHAPSRINNKSKPVLSSITRLSAIPRRRYLLFVFLVAPAFLLRLTTAAWPILQTIQESFTNFDVIKNTNSYIGAQNFNTILNDFQVHSAISFTTLLVVFSTLGDLIVGMLVALLLNANFRGRGFARTINLIPWAVPTIVAGYGFRWLLDNQFGLLPYWISQLTGYHLVAFINPPVAQAIVILAHIWKDAPFMAFVFLAGLQGVPLDLYDAARVDGANAWQRFWGLTVPLIMPLTITMGLFRLVWSLGSFDLVYGLTQGGPGEATSVLALQIFRNGIMFFKFGYASAISVVLLLFVAGIGIVGLALFRRFEVSL
jgi:multiple sugar transport system permease protein